MLNSMYHGIRRWSFGEKNCIIGQEPHKWRYYLDCNCLVFFVLLSTI